MSILQILMQQNAENTLENKVKTKDPQFFSIQYCYKTVFVFPCFGYAELTVLLFFLLALTHKTDNQFIELTLS